NVAMCSERQLMILESAHVMLRPGGRLVYSTCTFSEEENENVIREFLQRHPEYHVPAAVSVTGAPAAVAPPETTTDTPDLRSDILASCGVTPTDPGCWRIYPHLAPGEGHFAAVLEKSVPATAYAGEMADSKRNPKNKRSDKKQPSSAAFYKPLYTFMEETLTPSCDTAFVSAVRSCDTSRLYSLGQQIYLLPKNCPAPDGIKLQRPGLHLGMLKNDRFEPSLALARALTASNVSSYVNFCAFVADTDLMYSVDEADYTSQARCLQDYFTGNTLPATDQKGWTLVCIAGIGIGWGKSSGGIIKNHYPKGLRKQLDY
ncbi:MAG: RsmF rRNA methyltransferase first C-terminal domain-containing protein, partial [Lachnospiraceae bacterium]|nr:RsmF rRNA methyltransferase first C-terminal domain-containing protein [Lachnospiraceae bacterium]